MGNLKNIAGGAAIFLSQAFPAAAAADEDNGRYAVGRECVVDALRDSFGPGLEIVETPEGAGGFMKIGNGHVSRIIAVEPSGLVQSINVQVDGYTVAEDFAISVNASYATGQRVLSILSDGRSPHLDDNATELVRQLDHMMRRCAGPALMG